MYLIKTFSGTTRDLTWHTERLLQQALSTRWVWNQNFQCERARIKCCSGGPEPFLPTWECLFGTNRRRSQPRQTGETFLLFQICHHWFFKPQVKENHKWWYKPHITREDAINLLKSQSPGTFIVRDSNTFPDSFGLALKVLLTNCQPLSSFPIVRWQLHLRMGNSSVATVSRVQRSWSDSLNIVIHMTR